MKVNDLVVENHNYDNFEGTSEFIQKLSFYQKYIQLLYNDELYNLEIIHVDKNSFIVKKSGLVSEGIK